MTQLKTKLK